MCYKCVWPASVCVCVTGVCDWCVWLMFVSVCACALLLHLPFRTIASLRLVYLFICYSNVAFRNSWPHRHIASVANHQSASQANPSHPHATAIRGKVSTAFKNDHLIFPFHTKTHQRERVREERPLKRKVIQHAWLEVTLVSEKGIPLISVSRYAFNDQILFSCIDNSLILAI